MSGVVADTHAILWYLNGGPRLSEAAARVMLDTIGNDGAVIVAAISLVEVAYLVEKRRIAPDSFEIVFEAITNPSSGFVLRPLDLQVLVALRGVPRSAVPDMPDRIIAAPALALGLPLVSRDRKITASIIQTIW